MGTKSGIRIQESKSSVQKLGTKRRRRRRFIALLNFLSLYKNECNQQLQNSRLRLFSLLYGQRPRQNQIPNFFSTLFPIPQT
ncbi:hypothetical protein MIMGU_mgv11b014497mg [Erythranthe guttata]|uniref:Uncharacterized protein n=1 Tax=Erythranthe guttata TaxID=4155 RepID=A0A022Q7U7_ERYGU|nr:hypothetical protein MIMGU_mgv11b014497mg [Erythranthe guttata]